MSQMNEIDAGETLDDLCDNRSAAVIRQPVSKKQKV